jgi:hypothetical protein
MADEVGALIADSPRNLQELYRKGRQEIQDEY